MPTGLPGDCLCSIRHLKPPSKSKEALSTNNYFLRSSVFLTELLGGKWVDNYASEVKVFIWKTLTITTCLSHLKTDDCVVKVKSV